MLEDLGDEAGANEALRTVRRMCEEPTRRGRPDTLHSLAAARLQAWDFEGALRTFEREGAGASVVQAVALRCNGDLPRGLAVLDALVTERRESPSVLRSRALFRCASGDLDGAAGDAEMAVKADRGRRDAWPLLTRAFVRALLDDVAGSISDLAEAQRRQPRFHHLALWRLALGDGHVKQPSVDELPPWPRRLVVGAFAGEPPDALRVAAGALAGARARIIAQQEVDWFYGLEAERAAPRADSIAHLERVVSLGDTNWLQYTWAFARLRQWGLAPVHRPPRPLDD